MNDSLIAYIRTYVPIVVGSVISWLFVNYGVVVSEDIASQATIVLTGAVIAVYYAAVRVLSSRWPVFGRLLGVAKDPSYAEGE